MQAKMSSDDHFLDDEDLKKKGKEFLKRINMNYDYFTKLMSEKKDDVAPVKKGDIPKIAVLLGLLDPFFYDLYSMCDGKRTIAKLSQILDLDTGAVKLLVNELIKNGLIKNLEDEK